MDKLIRTSSRAVPASSNDSRLVLVGVCLIGISFVCAGLVGGLHTSVSDLFKSINVTDETRREEFEEIRAKEVSITHLQFLTIIIFDVPMLITGILSIITGCRKKSPWLVFLLISDIIAIIWLGVMSIQKCVNVARASSVESAGGFWEVLQTSEFMHLDATRMEEFHFHIYIYQAVVAGISVIALILTISIASMLSNEFCGPPRAEEDSGLELTYGKRKRMP